MIGIAKGKKGMFDLIKFMTKTVLKILKKMISVSFSPKNLEMKHIDLLFPLIRKEEEERSDLHHLITLTE